MIDRVNGNHYTNAYTNSSVKKADGESAPDFLLDYDPDGVVWDRQEKNSEDEAKKLNIKPRSKPPVAQGKDTFESTIIKTDTNTDAVKDNKSEIQGTSISDFLKDSINKIKDFFVNLFNEVWYGGETTSEEKSNTNSVNKAAITKTSEPKEKIIDPAERDKLIRESIKTKDSDEIMRILTEDYTKLPARNSSLLTKYDRHGQIVDINAADEAQIVKGKNAIKI